MQKTPNSDSLFTQQVKTLLTKVHHKSVLSDSVYERASDFYRHENVVNYQKETLQQEITELNQTLAKAPEKDKKALTAKLKKLKKNYQSYSTQLVEQRLERLHHLITICYEIIHLSEGESFEETNRKSAKFLGTIQLISPTEGKHVALNNARNKPVYKAVLALRLLDRLCIDGVIPSYVKGYLGAVTPEEYASFAEIAPDDYLRFVDFVKVPLVAAAILQDIGNLHGDAQTILVGEQGDKNPYRTLELEERKNLLQIDYRETIRYLAEGLGQDKYVGNSKADREVFNENEKKKLIFIKDLLKSSINPKQGSGNLLKVPQIYASIILSTKENYNYKLLPKVYQALNQNAERGQCSQAAVDALRKITGDFPQGFGVSFIPLDSDGNKLDRYEYAIVNQLYPKKPEEPLCRTSTRNLTFIAHANDIVVKADSNLYFAENAKQLARISKERLHEILEVLASNFVERKKLDLIPRCWHAADFFALKGHQKLWNKAD